MSPLALLLPNTLVFISIMLAASIFIAAFAGVVAADPLIYTPAQGQVGGECSFTWSADPTGVWKKMVGFSYRLILGLSANIRSTSSSWPGQTTRCSD
jgi:hypothetical protein